MSDDKFEGWCILELMGHRRLGGYVREAVVAGASFVRLDVPCDPPATQFYSASAIYCLTPTTEEIARAMARAQAPTPVQRWELPPAPLPPATTNKDDEAPDEDDDESPWFDHPEGPP